MEDKNPTIFTFEIDNFLEKEGVIRSPKFLTGGCEWHLQVYPKGNHVDGHLSIYLHVSNPESLRLGWKRRATYSFVLLNQSGKEIYKSSELLCMLFCHRFSAWGREKVMPFKKLKEKCFLEKNKMIVKVQVQVIEVVDEAEVTGKETLDIKGFQVLYSQVVSVSKLFIQHPDIAENFKPNNQLVRTTYMNILLSLIETLKKPPHSLSETELTKASSELIDLTEAGFKLDWLKTKLDEVSLERKKGYDDSRVQEFEEQVKNLNAELNMEKEKSATYAAKVVSLEKTASDTKELNIKLKTKFDEVSLESKKRYDDTRVQELEEQVKNLKAELNIEKEKSAIYAAKVVSLEKTASDIKELNKKLKTNLDEVSLERKKGYDDSRVQELEEQVKNLKAELNIEKEKSAIYAAKVVSLEKTASDIRELNKKWKLSPN